MMNEKSFQDPNTLWGGKPICIGSWRNLPMVNNSMVSNMCMAQRVVIEKSLQTRMKLVRLSPLTRLQASFPPGGTFLKSPTVWIVKICRIALHRLWCFKSYSGWEIWHSAFTTNTNAKYLHQEELSLTGSPVHALQFPQSNFSITLRKTSLIFVWYNIISHANKTFSIFLVYKFST